MKKKFVQILKYIPMNSMHIFRCCISFQTFWFENGHFTQETSLKIIQHNCKKKSLMPGLEPGTWARNLKLSTLSFIFLRTPAASPFFAILKKIMSTLTFHLIYAYIYFLSHKCRELWQENLSAWVAKFATSDATTSQRHIKILLRRIESVKNSKSRAMKTMLQIRTDNPALILLGTKGVRVLE